MRLRKSVIQGKPSTEFRRLLTQGPWPVVGMWGATAHHAQLTEATGFKYFAAIAAMILPTRVEPVKFTRLTAGCEMSASATASASFGSCVITLTTPSPNPASVNTAPIKR